MRILWVKVGGLWPLNTGGRLRSFHIVRELARRHRVTVLTTHGPEDDAEGLARNLPEDSEVVSFPYAAPKQGSAQFVTALLRSWASPLPVDLWRWRVPPLQREVRRLIDDRKIDLCVADFLAAVPNVPCDASVPVVYFSHNVEHMIWQRLSLVEPQRWRRLLLEVEWRKMRRFEARACAGASLAVAVSERDRDLLAVAARSGNVTAIPTGVDTTYFAPNGTPEAAKTLVFSGSMDWYPNEDAILYFMAEILPRIRREMPGVTLTIVGRNPRSDLRAAAAHAGVRVTGTVADVRPYLAEGEVYVVPLRVGGGTRLKIFEALAMEKAVVSTSVGAEGLPLVSGEHFLAADDPEAFARTVIRLLCNPAQRRALGMAGRRLVEERFSWPRVASDFEAKCQEAMAIYAR